MLRLLDAVIGDLVGYDLRDRRAIDQITERDQHVGEEHHMSARER